MKTITVTPSTPINQSQLKRLLKLSPSVIRHLKETNQLKFNRVGRQDVFDEVSVRLFMDSFNRDDYLTIGECRKILERWRFYTFRMGWKRIYIFPLGFYISVKTLIKGNSDIPKEYRPKPRKFGKTQYIRRSEFALTLNWLRNVNHKVNPRKPNSFVVFNTKPKKPKKLGLGGLKKMNTTRQPTPHPMIIPSMVCPLQPLTH